MKYLSTLTKHGKVLNEMDKPGNIEPRVFSASGYSRLMQILTGNVPSIYSFGIISAENPMGQSISPEENRKRIKEMKEFLRAGNFGYIQHKGKYGVFENPFLIMNVNRKVLNSLVSPGKFHQQAYIFGIVGKNNVVFQWIEGGKVLDERKVVLTTLGDRDDFYSEYKGRRFFIPFFDSLYENKEMPGGKVIDSNLYTPEKVSYQYMELLKTSQKDAMQIIERNSKVSNFVAGKVDGSGIWGNRGYILALLNRIQKLEK